MKTSRINPTSTSEATLYTKKVLSFKLKTIRYRQFKYRGGKKCVRAEILAGLKLYVG
ncbi:unnamed protein product, partial [marine sediment metagenome]